MAAERQALYLLADSQLLFWKSANNRVLSSLKERFSEGEKKIIRAAYLGASNGDEPVFYHLFESALESLGECECLMIPSSPDEHHLAYLAEADLILLAGGDVARGWQVIEEFKLDAILNQCYFSGASLIGVSAGAIHLSMGFLAIEAEPESFQQAMKMCPYYISAHDEGASWLGLKNLLEHRETYAKGYGIPFGGGMLYHPDNSVEPVRMPITEFSYTADDESRLLSNVLLPPSPD